MPGGAGPGPAADPGGPAPAADGPDPATGAAGRPGRRDTAVPPVWDGAGGPVRYAAASRHPGCSGHLPATAARIGAGWQQAHPAVRPAVPRPAATIGQTAPTNHPAVAGAPLRPGQSPGRCAPGHPAHASAAAVAPHPGPSAASQPPAAGSGPCRPVPKTPCVVPARAPFRAPDAHHRFAGRHAGDNARPPCGDRLPVAAGPVAAVPCPAGGCRAPSVPIAAAGLRVFRRRQTPGSAAPPARHGADRHRASRHPACAGCCLPSGCAPACAIACGRPEPLRVAAFSCPIRRVPPVVSDPACHTDLHPAPAPCRQPCGHGHNDRPSGRTWHRADDHAWRAPSGAYASAGPAAADWTEFARRAAVQSPAGTARQ